MHARPRIVIAPLALAALLLGMPAAAQAPRPAPAPQAAPAAQPVPATAARDNRSGALQNLGSNKEPIKIDADRLDVFDREGRAVFAGNVVAVQGDSTIRCSSMTVLYEQRGAPGATAAPRAPGASESSIKKIDCAGPVTVVSKTQTATSDTATFDRAANKVYLIGNAVLTDGPNTVTGPRIVYDVETARANVEGGRVRSVMVPGSAEPGKPEASKPADAAKPAPKPAVPAAASPAQRPAAPRSAAAN